MFKKSKFLILMSFILCILMIFSGCGRKSTEGKFDTDNRSATESKANVENNSSAPVVTSVDGTQSNSVNVQFTEQINASQDFGKIIVSKEMFMETLAFDKAVKGITNNILSSGGYIENSEVTGRGIKDSSYVESRTANIKARIPKNKFSSVTDSIEKYGVIIRTNIQSQNVTDQYFDTEARVKTQKIREERLLELLKKSGKLEDIITLEKELSQVRLEIENLTGSLRHMDNLVEYSTLTLSIQEVTEPTQIKDKPVTLWQRIKDGFMKALELIDYCIKNILVIIAFLFPFAIIAFIIYLACRYVWKIPKKNKKDEEKDNNK